MSQALKMSRHSFHHSGNDSSSPIIFLKQISQDLQSLQLRRQQDVLPKENERIERETHIVVLQEELRMLRDKDDFL